MEVLLLQHRKLRSCRTGTACTFLQLECRDPSLRTLLRTLSAQSIAERTVRNRAQPVHFVLQNGPLRVRRVAFRAAQSGSVTVSVGLSERFRSLPIRCADVADRSNA